MRTLIVVFLLLAGQSALAADDEARTLRADSRSDYVHRLTLYDHDGAAIDPTDPRPPPYSPARTCGKCHAYGTISTGWHFNALRGDTDSGRPGEPWLPPQQDGTQAISDRAWPGVTPPAEVGLSDFEMTRRFGHHFPGGGYGSPGEERMNDSDEFLRWGLSGPLEIDCMFCHCADQSHDPAEAGRQIERENFRWASTAALGLGVIRGDASRTPDDFDPLSPPDPDFPERALPYVEYDAARFDPDGRVLFSITRRPSVERCYFCHSQRDVSSDAAPDHQTGRDVHIAAGLLCVDCHRNGIDHNITRGDRHEAHRREDPSLAVFSCAGCHGLLDANTSSVAIGRYGAPIPTHAGIPPLHFERLTCTACHSGPLPRMTPRRLQTSLAHGLGTPTRDRHADSAPEILAPLFAPTDDGRVGVFRLAPGAASDGGDLRWPLAHDVRPAAQSLGARGCADCHATDAPFLYGATRRADVEQAQEMHALAQLDPTLLSAWNQAIRGRAAFKLASLIVLLLLSAVLLRFTLRGLDAACRRFGASP